MSELFIHRMQIKKQGCLKDVDLELSRFRALIGPNDSGKSTILRAIEALFAFAQG